MENQGTTSNYCPGNFDDGQGFNNNNNIGLDQYNINEVTSDDHTGADEPNIVIPTDASDVSGVGTSTTGEQLTRVRCAATADMATADMISSSKRRAPIDDEDAPSRQLIVGESSSFFAQSLNEQVSGQVESFERNVRPRRDQPTVLFPRDQFPNSVSYVLEQQGNSENVPRNMTIIPETERETLAHESTNESTSISLGQVSNFGRPAHSGGASSAVREVEHSMSGGHSSSTQISGDRTQSGNSPGIAQRMTSIMSRLQIIMDRRADNSTPENEERDRLEDMSVRQDIENLHYVILAVREHAIREHVLDMPSTAGLREEAIVAHLGQYKYQCVTTGDPVEDEKCCICQEEFVEGEDLGKLDNCRHKFHFNCIKEWLQQENSCPICRRTALVLRDPLGQT